MIPESTSIAPGPSKPGDGWLTSERRAGITGGRTGDFALLELGAIYEELGQLELARAAYEASVERDPESYAAATCRERLQQRA